MTIESEVAIAPKVGSESNFEQVVLTLNQRIEVAKKLPAKNRLMTLKSAVRTAITQTPAELLFSTSWKFGSKNFIAAFVEHYNRPGTGAYLLTDTGELLIRKADNSKSDLERAKDSDWLKLGQRLARPFEIALMRSYYHKTNTF